MDSQEINKLKTCQQILFFEYRFYIKNKKGLELPSYNTCFNTEQGFIDKLAYKCLYEKRDTKTLVSS